MPSLYILLAIFLWSSLGVFVRLSGVSVHVLIFYSIAISVIVQAIILMTGGYRKKIPNFGKLKYPVILGFLSLANMFTFFFAFQNTTIANAILTHYIAPVIVAFIAPLVLKEAVTKRVIFAIVLSSLGLWIMLGGFSLEKSHSLGIIAGLISGFAYAIIIIFTRLHTRKFNPLVLSFFTNSSIVLMLIPFVRETPFKAVWIFIVMGTVHSTIAPVLYYKGLQSVPANRAAVLGYLEPVCAIIFGLFLLKEIPAVKSIIGGILIIISGYLTLRDKVDIKSLK